MNRTVFPEIGAEDIALISVALAVKPALTFTVTEPAVKKVVVLA